MKKIKFSIEITAEEYLQLKEICQVTHHFPKNYVEMIICNYLDKHKKENPELFKK